MAEITGVGTIWTMPNYAGELFTSDPKQTPFLSMAGGLTGGKQTMNFEFPTAIQFNQPDPTQPDISEDASIIAPAAKHLTREQETNVVQIHQETVDISYVKQSNSGRMSGLNTAGQEANPAAEKAWQIEQKLRKIARDVEYSFICGKYNKAGDSSVANRTRGMLELAETSATIAAGGAELSMSMLNSLYREMAAGGAYFDNMVMFCNADQKQRLTQIYNAQLGFNLPATRGEGGIDITNVITDFFNLSIVWNRFMPTDAVLLADMAHVAPVFQAVPGKGVLFEEQLAKVGASDRVMLFGQIGLAHGPAFLHGSITGLATA